MRKKTSPPPKPTFAESSESGFVPNKPSGVSPASEDFLGFEPYATPEVAAEFLKVTPRRIKDMARAGAVPAHPVDANAERKEWRFRLSELSAWMQDNTGKKR